eukprot:XP_027303144.1 BLOC-1-related complex subunit 8 [Anas platyrhynchos]
MEEPEMQLKVKKVTDKFTESMYVLANEPSVALYRLQEHVRRSLPELAQHKVSRASLRPPDLRHSQTRALFLSWNIIPILGQWGRRKGISPGGTNIVWEGLRCCGTPLSPNWRG